MLSSQWTVRDFYPIDDIPRGVRLTSYGGDARDLPPHVLQAFLDAAAAGDAVIPVDHVYRLDEIAEGAHRHRWRRRHRGGKLVVLTSAAAPTARAGPQQPHIRSHHEGDSREQLHHLIGVVGAGGMGTGVTRRLTAAGHTVLVTDSKPGTAATVAAEASVGPAQGQARASNA